MKRWLSFLLVCLCLFSVAVAEEAQKTYVLAGYDNTEYRTWSTNQFFLDMEALSGVHFTYDQYKEAAKWAQKKQSLTAGSEMPDVLFKADLSSAEALALYEQGVLQDLAPYLEENCPNLWAVLQANPSYLDEITLPGGRILSLPYITNMPSVCCIWINKTWLDALKLPMPTDAASLQEVLTAFKTKDPNRNGKADEIPLAFLGAFDLEFLAHAYGLISNDYHVFEQDGQVRFMPLEEQFRPFIIWCRELYSQGLLDKQGFSTSDALRKVSEDTATKQYGAIITTLVSTILPVAWLNDYVAVPVLAYEGTQVYRQFMGEVRQGAFAITTHCDDPALLLRWVDILYSEEGARLANFGKEGTDYLIDPDGTWRMADNLSSFFSVSNLIGSGSSTPGIEPSLDFQYRYNDGSMKTTSDQIKLVADIATKPFPTYHLTAAQEAEILPLQNAIGRYVDEQIARWVLGEDEISDASFAAFEKTLTELGLDAFLAFWQNVLNQLK